jgi:hypothetical protein
VIHCYPFLRPQWKPIKEKSKRRRMPLFSSRRAGWDFYRECRGDCRRKSASRSNQAQCLCGMSVKLACGDGRTGSHGVRVECPAAFSRTAKWKANEEGLDYHLQPHLQRRKNRMAQEVQETQTMAARTTTKRGQMDTDTSLMD